MRKILIFLFLLCSIVGFSQFNSPYYHKVITDTVWLKKSSDSLWQIKLNRTRDTLWLNGRPFLGGEGGGGGGITDITYPQLLSAISGKTLSKGGYYKLTDYQTVHYYVDGTTRIDTAINAGNVEPLVLFATSDSSIDKNVYSSTFPNDIIYYDPDSTHFITDISFSHGSTMVTGFRGVITYRNDTKQDNYTYYDFRNVKFRRWAVVLDSLQATVIDTTSTPYQSWQSSTLTVGNSWIVNINPNRWYDYYTLGDYYSTVHSVHVESSNLQHVYTILNNTVFITISGGNTSFCNIGSSNFDNTLIHVSYISSVSYFLNNILENDCGPMTFGNGCGPMTFGNGCGAMTFGNYCGSMTFGNGCGGMTFGNDCGAMTFGNGDQFIYLHDLVNSINLSASAIATSSYNKELYIASDNSIEGKYTDNLGCVHYFNPTNDVELRNDCSGGGGGDMTWTDHYPVSSQTSKRDTVAAKVYNANHITIDASGQSTSGLDVSATNLGYLVNLNLIYGTTLFSQVRNGYGAYFLADSGVGFFAYSRTGLSGAFFGPMIYKPKYINIYRRPYYVYANLGDTIINYPISALSADTIVYDTNGIDLSCKGLVIYATSDSTKWQHQNEYDSAGNIIGCKWVDISTAPTYAPLNDTSLWKIVQHRIVPKVNDSLVIGSKQNYDVLHVIGNGNFENDSSTALNAYSCAGTAIVATTCNGLALEAQGNVKCDDSVGVGKKASLATLDVNGNIFANAGTVTGITSNTTTGISFYGYASSTGEGGSFTSVDNYGCEGQSVNSVGGYFHSQNSEGLDCSSIFNYALHVAGRTKLDTVLSGGNSMLTWDSITKSVHRQPLPIAGTNYWTQDHTLARGRLYPSTLTDSLFVGQTHGGANLDVLGNIVATISGGGKAVFGHAPNGIAVAGYSENATGVNGSVGNTGSYGGQFSAPNGSGVYATTVTGEGLQANSSGRGWAIITNGKSLFDTLRLKKKSVIKLSGTADSCVYFDRADSSLKIKALPAGSTGTVTNIGIGYGVSSTQSPLTTSGTIKADSTVLASKPYVTTYTADRFQTILGFTPENITNKSNVTGTSTVKYATQNLVKTYADSIKTTIPAPTTYTATLPVVVTGTVISLNTDSLASLARRKDTVNFIVSKPYLTTYVANRFLTLGSAWLHADTAGTLASKSFFETYTTNRFLGLGNAWLHADTSGTIVSKSFLSTYATNRFQPLGAYLTAVSGTNLDNIWSNNGILTRTGTGTYSYVTDNSTTWNSLVTFPGFGSTGSKACVGNDSRLSDTRNIAGGTNGAVPYQSGANTTGIVAATATANKLFMSGASATPTWSIPTYPNTGTLNKVLIGDGTNIIQSAYTVAAPGAVGNGMISDGTNWTSASALSASNWTVVKVSGSDFTTSSASLVDITGLSFTAVASTTYLIDAWLDCTTSAVTTGVEFGINSTGSSPVVLWNMVSSGSSTTAVTAGNVANNTADATAVLTTSGQEGFVHITGIVKSGTGSPTISIRGLKVTSGTLTVKIGSRLMYMVQ